MNVKTGRGGRRKRRNRTKPFRGSYWQKWDFAKESWPHTPKLATLRFQVFKSLQGWEIKC